MEAMTLYYTYILLKRRLSSQSNMISFENKYCFDSLFL